MRNEASQSSIFTQQMGKYVNQPKAKPNIAKDN